MTITSQKEGIDDQANADDSSKKGMVERRGARLYFVASLISQASALVRYVVLARILGPEQLGLAATLVVTASFFDLISDTGADRFLVQDRDGDLPQVQQLVQLVYVSRGFLIAIALVVLGGPIAAFFGTPRLAAGFAVLAFSPLILGFLHLDIRRVQRVHDFTPQANAMICAEIAGLIAIVAAAFLTRDFTSILYGLITRALVMVALSHAQASRAYRLGWDRDHWPRLSRFAAPLMVNGVLLFVVSQGDRVIVGSQLGVKALGFYSALILLVYYPTALLANYIHAIYIPLVAAERDSLQARLNVSDGLGGLTLLLAMGTAVGFAIVAPIIGPLLFGSRFAQPAQLVALIGILQATRFLLSWPTTVALAMGRSLTVLLSNLAHVFVVPCAFLGMQLVGGLNGITAGFAAGEVFAFALAQWLLNRGMGVGPLHGFDRLGLFVLSCGAIIGWNITLSARLWAADAGMLAGSVALIAWLWKRESAAIRDTVNLLRRVVPSVRVFNRRGT